MSESGSEVGMSGSDKCLRVEATLIAKLNLADFQNAVPLLRELSIINDTGAEAKDLELQIVSAPGFLKPKIWRVDAVAPGGSCRIPDVDVVLDGALLTRLTEAEKASITLTLRHRDDPSSDL